MSKQLNLLEVVRDGPTRKQRMEAFKKAHGIETHYAGKGWLKEDGPWIAICLPQCRKALAEYGATHADNLFDLFAKYCRLMDDWDLIGYGGTEREAIRKLSEINHKPCDL